MDNEFMVQPSKRQLERDLELIQKIINCQVAGQKVIMKDGEVIVKSLNKEESLGTLTDLAALEKELFGDSLAEGVKYRTIDGITFMNRWYGKTQKASVLMVPL
ncbi:MAG: hypothetical protein NC399_09350 [Muribaculum sp.]|nr:hypothetical protein [Muribaculum sp.]